MSERHPFAQVAEGLTRQHPGDDLVRSAVGVVGDLASTLGPRFKQVAKQPPHKEYIRQLLKDARTSSEEATQQVARWAHQAVYDTRYPN